jgi:hypothetical protein
VFKRFDPGKLFVLVGQDVTERFHLLLSVCFVVVEVRPDQAACAAARTLSAFLSLPLPPCAADLHAPTFVLGCHKRLETAPCAE